VRRNSTRERIIREVDDSLRRLQTDYIDIYQIHWPDPLVPIQETAEAMQQLYYHGKIRAIGVSNYSIEQMNLFRAATPLHMAQPPYNLFEREIEQEVLPFCRRLGIITLVYGALCRGLLSGKMRPDRRFVGDDVRKVDPKFQLPATRSIWRRSSSSIALHRRITVNVSFISLCVGFWISQVWAWLFGEHGALISSMPWRE